MQVIVFTQKTGELVLHSGPYTLSTNHIVKLEKIANVLANNGYYEAKTDNGSVKLRVPYNKTNVIYI